MVTTVSTAIFIVVMATSVSPVTVVVDALSAVPHHALVVHDAPVVAR
jgi:hypothetical protein